MAVVEDWAQKAALEIATVFTDTPAVSAMWIAPLIRRWMPFQEGVAYMPVPRCDACRWWERHKDEGEGFCGILEVNLSSSFGCVRWKDKSDVDRT